MKHLVKLASLLALFAVIANASAQEAVKFRNLTAVEWIEMLKTHKEAKNRKAALLVVGGVFGPKTAGVLPAITGALEADSEPDIRQQAAALLGQMGDDAKGSVYALREALVNDKAGKVREAAAVALGELSKFSHEYVLTLAKALNDPHEGTRAAAAEAILKMKDKAGPAMPDLMKLAGDPSKDRFSRQFALKCIARIGTDDNEVAKILIAVLAEKDAAVPLRAEAADGLGRSTLAAAKVLPPLADALADPSLEVKRAAAAALAKQGQHAEIVWPKVVAALGAKESDNAVRYQLLRLAGQLAKTMNAAVPVLLDHAKKDPHIENRIAAIQELGQLSDPPAAVTKALEELSREDANPNVRAAAEATLKKTGM